MPYSPEFTPRQPEPLQDERETPICGPTRWSKRNQHKIGSRVVFGLLKRLLGGGSARSNLEPLYQALVEEARHTDWYVHGMVPDTIDGRFDMVGALMSLVLLRFEQLGEAGQEPAVLLTETFVDDMDGQLREAGIGDIVVGKHVGKMMSALGGRITAYRAALTPGGNLDEALLRNLYRGEIPPAASLRFVAQRLRAFEGLISTQSVETLLAAKLIA
jgi:cytochrome b pre-mRNA-processing protein 3